MPTRLWTFLTTDIQDLISTNTLSGGVETTNAVLGLAEALKTHGPKIGQIAPYVGRMDSLLDVLNSPLAEIAEASLPFVSIATGLLKFYLEKTKQNPTLAQCVALVSQAAYLDAFKASLKRPKEQQMLMRVGQRPASQAVAQCLQCLKALELDDKSARLTLLCFHESSLAAAFNQVLSIRLTELGFESADKLAEQVARTTDQYLLPALASMGSTIKKLVEWYCMGGPEVLEKYWSIETYLQEQISPNPTNPQLRGRWQVLGESFTLQEIYVPLQAQPIDDNGNPDPTQSPVNLKFWARDLLTDEEQARKIIFIQAGPGRGKSAFCQIFADMVRQHLHPSWTPILIRLRDITTFENSFEKTLQTAVGWNFAKDGWLTDRNTRFLFLLDGFDELLLERRTSEGLRDFLWQVDDFQRSCQQNPERGHRILITGRPLALQGIEGRMPPNLNRVEILPLDDRQMSLWLGQWEKLAGPKKAQAFKTFLQDAHCPNRFRELAREPLLLYLLAAMHRDGELAVEMVEGNCQICDRIRIYEKSLDWVLTQQRPDWLTQKLTEQEIDDLKLILAEAGLCVVQAGGESAPVSMIEDRLQEEPFAKTLIERTQQYQDGTILKNALTAFYLEAGDDRITDGSVEFTHKSFGEFLCAQRLKDSLTDWSQLGNRRRRQEFYVSTEEMAWEIYDLLGYGGLTPEIVDHLMALLSTSSDFSNPDVVVLLFRRLERFYWRWCNGDFIDLSEGTLPQRKTRQFQAYGLQIGQRRVDIYTGLNVLILLLELHRYTKNRQDLKDCIDFYPCGEKSSGTFDRGRLLRVVSYSDSFGRGEFSAIVGSFLSQANLQSAYLSGAFLGGVNLHGVNLHSAFLCGAYLRGVDFHEADLGDASLNGAFLRRANFHKANLAEVKLRDADLAGANLQGANLREADLSGSYLRDTDLRGANLNGANLRGAYLSRALLCNATLQEACLSGANLHDANLRGAHLKGAYFTRTDLENLTWDQTTILEDIKGLDTAAYVPEALQREYKNAWGAQ